eukprot:4312381-Amphidinium_carterae.1
MWGPPRFVPFSWRIQYGKFVFKQPHTTHSMFLPVLAVSLREPLGTCPEDTMMLHELDQRRQWIEQVVKVFKEAIAVLSQDQSCYTKLLQMGKTTDSLGRLWNVKYPLPGSLFLMVFLSLSHLCQIEANKSNDGSLQLTEFLDALGRSRKLNSEIPQYQKI